jgi:hypothetical protein
MHEIGLRITNEQIRDDEVIRSGNVEYWEFTQNGNAAVQQEPFTVKPGDSFRTTCYFEDADGSRSFGLASSQEMCMGFLYYYPRKVIDLGPVVTSWFCGYNYEVPGCNATHQMTSLGSKDDIGRQYAIANDVCFRSNETNDSGDESGSASIMNTLASILAIVASTLLM